MERALSRLQLTSSPAPSVRGRSYLSDDVARRYLVRVIALARRMGRRLPPHVALSDLVSAGLLGVVEGFVRFDPSRAETLDAYIDHRIRGAFLDELRRADPLTRSQRDFARRLARASRSCAVAPSEESLAGALGVSVSRLRARVSQVSAAMAIRSSVTADRVEDATVTPHDEVEARQTYRLLARATEALPAREREVLRLYYEEGETFREIGALLGVSESRVSQLHSRAIQCLRGALAA
jgi:RNA polymerase sigma factor FliA